MSSNSAPLTVDRLLDIAYDYYEDFYENPRGISYFALANKLAHQNIRVLDYVAESLDLACRDAKNDIEKRSRDEVIEIVGHPTDDRWDLVEE